MPAICIKICEVLAARTRGGYLNIVGPFTSSFYQTSSGGVLLEAVTYIRVAFLEVPATTFFRQNLKMTQGTVGFAARDGASKWRPESASLGTAPISRRRIFLQKNVKSIVFHH